MEKKLFNFVIGNPPYQEETRDTSDKPVYNYFMDAAYDVADKVELVHPARFLFNAGKTPKAWNEKMLVDPHFKVLHYEQDSSKVFSNTNIMGGIAITYRDEGKILGPIETFSAFPELNGILHKVGSHAEGSFSSLIFAPESYRFTELLHKEFPNVGSLLSKGHMFDLTTNIFDKLSNIVFFDNVVQDGHEYIQIYGRRNNQRVGMWIRREYVKKHDNLDKWKVILPKSNGSGAIGEVVPTPLIGQPFVGKPTVGHNQSFISAGKFDTEYEADACYKYICSRFARTLLGILKVTQDNKKAVWKYVPLQDFTPASDIDWSKSVHEIDLQLYRKYGLDEDEIEFIESHVKEMV